MSELYTDNPNLKYISLPFEWKGTPIDKNGRFLNHEHIHNHSLQAFLKWQTTRNIYKTEKKKSTWKHEVVEQDFMQSTDDCIVWLGHASFFIRLNNINILIDPILFDISLLKRQTKFPIHPDQLIGIDIILISHDHRDHLDEKSIKYLLKKNPNAQFLTGLKIDSILQSFTKSSNIQAAGWYQQYKLNNDLKITYVPSRHWGRRLLRDTNSRLWGGFLIQFNATSIYFSGDTGYGSHFKDIAEIVPHLDYCIIGIGAYKPEFFMAQSHISPTDALKAFTETKAKYMIPMHHSTFDLSDEPLHDPLFTLQNVSKMNNLSDRIITPKIGELIPIH